MPILLDNDGVAYYPKPSEGALDSVTLEQIREGIESDGVPIREARLTLPMKSMEGKSVNQMVDCIKRPTTPG